MCNSLAITAAQQADYYRELPEPAKSYTAATTTARFIDALGFRYYWATKDLRPQDLNYRPSTEARSTIETVNHILGLSQVIINTVMEKTAYPDFENLDFQAKRRNTLSNLRKASDLLRQAQPGDLAKYKVPMGSGYPFWNLMNGPIADAIYHVGQIVSFRRTTGNPINPNISVFLGSVRE